MRTTTTILGLMAILSTVKVSAEPAIDPHVINVQMKAGQIVELNAADLLS